MQSIRNLLAIVAAATLAACATQPPETPGRHLVVSDASGKLLMQFDYPTEDMCGLTAKAMRGSPMKAGCRPASSAEALRAHAMLRYTPPGVLVSGHYVDLATCERQTAQLAPGVRLLQPCTAK